MSNSENIPGRGGESAISSSGSPGSSNILNWIPRSLGDKSSASSNTPQRHRRDSSTLSPDEALNISRANMSKPINISGTPKTIAEDSSPSDSSAGSATNHKYDKLGLITAFSGGPGSF